MGLVYLAEQSQPVRRKVALKVLKPGMDTHEILGRFEVERNVLTIMNHPGIARVYDAGMTEQGRPYFVILARDTRLDREVAIKALPLLDGDVRSTAWGCNARGQTVGESSAPDNGTRPVLWENGRMHVLSTGAEYGRALGIDESGELIVGVSWNGPGHTMDGVVRPLEGVQGFVIVFDSFQRIGTLPSGSFSSLAAINNRGQAVGSADAEGFINAIRYNGTMVVIEPLVHDSHAEFNDINDEGVAVGFSGERAVVAYADRLIDLNELLEPGSGAGWLLENASGINNRGQIIASGRSCDGTRATFLLTPVRSDHADVD